MIKCGEHGRKVPGFISCRHVMYEGAPVAHFVAPRDDGGHPADDLGEVLCAVCHSKDFDTATEQQRDLLDQLMVVCAQCFYRVTGYRQLQ